VGGGDSRAAKTLEEAGRAFQRVVDLGPATLRTRGRVGLARVALDRHDPASAHEHALRALADAPNDAAATRLLAQVHAAAGDLEAALALYERLGEPALELAIRNGDKPRLARHAAAALSRDANDPLAQAAARGATRSDAAAPTDLPGLLRATHRLLLDHPELGALAPEAGRLVEAIDRPLVVAIMGEFNAGKSTFVNALVGEEIAPMGITPTTATINLLKYGAEPRGRIIYRDDRTEELGWAEVRDRLRSLKAEAARTIRLVEMLYPLEILQRVNVVDTPGLNSIVPEHEEVARDFVAQADAAVWLFSAGQAGKRTELDALERMQAARKRTLGVLNKIDRVAQSDEPALVEHLRATFGDRIEEIVPVSARDALAGRGGRFERLRAALEERFFSHARQIQRDAARTRLGALLQQAASMLPSPPPPREAERREIAGRANRFRGEGLASERVRLREGLERACADAAADVLEFVKPRTWAFGQHEAQPADRDFLVERLEEAIDSIADASAGRTTNALGEQARGRLDGRVYAPLRAFARGFLRGGSVDRFFTRTLPRMELSAPAVARSLLPLLPDLEEWLIGPLSSSARAHFDDARRQTELADRRDLALELEREYVLRRPLDELRRALDTIG
jgi:GTPase Era involved in 16S rRNA processing